MFRRNIQRIWLQFHLNLMETINLYQPKRESGKKNDNALSTSQIERNNKSITIRNMLLWSSPNKNRFMATGGWLTLDEKGSSLLCAEIKQSNTRKVQTQQNNTNRTRWITKMWKETFTVWDRKKHGSDKNVFVHSRIVSSFLFG